MKVTSFLCALLFGTAAGYGRIADHALQHELSYFRIELKEHMNCADPQRYAYVPTQVGLDKSRNP